MEKLNSIPILGKWNDIADKLNSNLQKIEQELIKLGYSTYQSTNFKGYYASLSALETAFPTPTIGDWAFVGEDAKIYQYANDDSSSFWEEGVSISSVFNIDLSNYLTNDADLSNNVIGSENLVDVLNSKLTSSSILYFDGIIDAVSNLGTGNPWNGYIYYSKSQDAFVMRQVGETYDLGYQSYTFLVNNISSIGTYNNYVNSTFISNKDNLYIDSDGNIYAFVNNVFTNIVKGRQSYTDSPVANRAIKELYIDTDYVEKGYYIHVIFRKWEDTANNLIKCQFVIFDADGNSVCQYYDQIVDADHEPPTFIELSSSTEGGISGYAVIDWSKVESGKYWYNRVVDQVAYLTPLCFEKELSPTIYATLNAVLYTEQSLTEEQQTQARVNIGIEDADGYTLIPNSGVVDSSNMKVAFPTASEEVQSDADVILEAKTPSGDPMHEAYVAAGAVWDATTKTWSANGRTGLSNADIRSLYNNSDMDELLFRKLWNTVNLADNNSANFGRYNPATGFYELNGIWDLTYQQALDIYANSDSGVSLTGSFKSLNLPLTTIRTNDTYFAGIVWSRIVDFNKTFVASADDIYLIPNSEAAQGTRIYYSRYLRRIYPMIYSGYHRNSYLKVVTCPSLLHVFFYRPNRNIYVNGAPLISYQSLFTLINYYRGTSGINVYVDADTYSYIAGNADPTTLSMSPIDNGYTDIIPYMKNHKGKLNEGVSVINSIWTPDNVYWREENDVKGINGEYIYPSFAEYLAANPDRFATAEDWQALATLAEEKGITITTA